MHSPKRLPGFRGPLVCLTVAMSILTVAGCHKDAGPKSEVVGKVIYKGQPLGATLSFNPDSPEGLPFTGSSGANGSFTFKGIAIGSYTVTVSTGMPTTSNDPRARGQKAPGAPGAMKPPPGVDPSIMEDHPAGPVQGGGSGVAIPSKYSDPKKSDWKVTIKEGRNDLGTFELKD